MQPRKLQCCLWRDSIKLSLRISWFCAFFVSKGNPFLLLLFQGLLKVKFGIELRCPNIHRKHGKMEVVLTCIRFICWSSKETHLRHIKPIAVFEHIRNELIRSPCASLWFYSVLKYITVSNDFVSGQQSFWLCWRPGWDAYAKLSRSTNVSKVYTLVYVHFKHYWFPE